MKHRLYAWQYRVGFLVLLAFGIGSVMLIGVYAAHAQETESESTSVELNLTELSPRGHAGGYAMPASGSSAPPCTYTFGVETPSFTVNPGGSVYQVYRMERSASTCPGGPYDTDAPSRSSYNPLTNSLTSGGDDLIFNTGYGLNVARRGWSSTVRSDAPAGTYTMRATAINPLGGSNVSDTFTVVVRSSSASTRPDLLGEIISITDGGRTDSNRNSGSGSVLRDGLNLTIRAEVTNDGSIGNNTPFNVRFDIYNSAGVRRSETLRPTSYSIGRDGGVRIYTQTFSSSAHNLLPGNYRARIFVDSSGEVAETNNSNNVSSWFYFTISAQDLTPDGVLSVSDGINTDTSSAAGSGASLLTGRDLSMVARVRNIGDFSNNTPFNVWFDIYSAGGVGRREVLRPASYSIGADAHRDYTVPFSLSDHSFPTGNYWARIVVDPDGEVREVSNSNNNGSSVNGWFYFTICDPVTFGFERDLITVRPGDTGILQSYRAERTSQNCYTGVYDTDAPFNITNSAVVIANAVPAGNDDWVFINTPTDPDGPNVGRQSWTFDIPVSAPEGTYTMRGESRNPMGGANLFDTFTLVVDADAPVCDSFTATPYTLPASGGDVTLAWQTSDADTVSIDNGLGPVALDGSTLVSVTADTTFILTATGPGGTSVCQVFVDVDETSGIPSGPPGLPVFSHSCSPAGDEVTITWPAVPGATSYHLGINNQGDPANPDDTWLDASDYNNTNVTTNSVTHPILPIGSLFNYNGRSQGPNGNSLYTTQVYAVCTPSSPGPGPSPSGSPTTCTSPGIEASPRAIRSGDSTELRWTNPTDAALCEVIGGELSGGSPVAANCSPVQRVDVSPRNTTTYELTCNGSVVDAVRVFVIPSFQEN